MCVPCGLGVSTLELSDSSPDSDSNDDEECNFFPGVRFEGDSVEWLVHVAHEYMC